MRKTKLLVSEHALVQRINRALKKEGKVLKKSRTERSRLDVGEWYILDTVGNYVSEKDVDLEQVGKEWEVLSDWETLLTD